MRFYSIKTSFIFGNPDKNFNFIVISTHMIMLCSLELILSVSFIHYRCMVWWWKEKKALYRNWERDREREQNHSNLNSAGQTVHSMISYFLVFIFLTRARWGNLGSFSQFYITSERLTQFCKVTQSIGNETRTEKNFFQYEYSDFLLSEQ